MHVLRKW